MKLLVIGAGGHAKVVIDAARAAGIEVAGVIGQPGDPAELLGIPVAMSADGVDADAFVVAIGDNETRQRYYDEYLAAGLSAGTVVHPATTIADGVAIGAGTFVAAGVVANVDARIGENAILNTGCTVDHDCVIGAHAHIGPGVSICGACTVGTGTLVGVGSSIAPGASVGEWSVVGAGATVVDDLPSRSVCVGVPARAIRETGR